jgi:hypothetical protein
MANDSVMFALRSVTEVRVEGAEIARKFVESFTLDQRAGRHIEAAALGIAVVESPRGGSSRRPLQTPPEDCDEAVRG